jgi:hypothetical protein
VASRWDPGPIGPLPRADIYHLSGQRDMVLLACLGPALSLESSPFPLGAEGYVSNSQLGQKRHSPQDPVLAVVISHDLGREGQEREDPCDLCTLDAAR